MAVKNYMRKYMAKDEEEKLKVIRIRFRVGRTGTCKRPCGGDKI
jgi:hypothetical protein